MKIGLTNIFSFRPHVNTLEYIARILEKDGHDLHFLTCDASLKACHNLLVNDRNKMFGCSTCMLGGIRSFRSKNISVLNSALHTDMGEKAKECAFSSFATSLRSETEEYFYKNYNPNALALHARSVEIAYANTVEWVRKESLEAVICFNGRMDVTRGVIEACNDHNIPYATYEYAWFGDGIHFIPGGNCLHLEQPLKLVTKYQNLPLTKRQVDVAAGVISRRILKTSDKEWRQYNMSAEYTDWPDYQNSQLKVLILPSSYNEFLGHEDYVADWQQPFDGFQAILEYLKDRNVNSVLRCHPNWGETISGISGDHIENAYIQWAADHQITTTIKSDEKADTFGLIQQADLVLLNSSSAALEAGIIGKPVVSTTPGRFQTSGFVTNIFTAEHLKRLDNIWGQDKAELVKLVLRYIYTYVRRLPQYVDQVKAVNPTQFNYFEGGNSDAILKMIKTGNVPPYDEEFSDSEQYENEVISELLNQNWNIFCKDNNEFAENTALDIHRRKAFKAVDKIRNLFPRGDLK